MEFTELTQTLGKRDGALLDLTDQRSLFNKHACASEQGWLKVKTCAYIYTCIYIMILKEVHNIRALKVIIMVTTSLNKSSGQT